MQYAKVRPITDATTEMRGGDVATYSGRIPALL